MTKRWCLSVKTGTIFKFQKNTESFNELISTISRRVRPHRPETGESEKTVANERNVHFKAIRLETDI